MIFCDTSDDNKNNSNDYGNDFEYMYNEDDKYDPLNFLGEADEDYNRANNVNTISNNPGYWDLSSQAESNSAFSECAFPFLNRRVATPTPPPPPPATPPPQLPPFSPCQQLYTPIPFSPPTIYTPLPPSQEILDGVEENEGGEEEKKAEEMVAMTAAALPPPPPTKKQQRRESPSSVISDFGNTTTTTSATVDKDDDDDDKKQKDHERMISSALSRLSVKEREQVYNEIHGVDDTLVKETPELIERSIAEMQQTLQSIPPKSRTRAIQYIHEHDPTFSRILYQDDSFLSIKFLRINRFQNVATATERLIRYLDWKLELFGIDKLFQNVIRYSDLDDYDIRALRRGTAQILPSRDRAGRAILVLNVDQEPKKCFFTASTIVRKNNIILSITCEY